MKAPVLVLIKSHNTTILPGLSFTSVQRMLRTSVRSAVFQRRCYAQDFKINRTLRLPKKHMYHIVGDVSKYQEFVPYCLESTLTKEASNGSTALALLRVGWQNLDEQFESKVVYTDDQVLASAADNSMFKELLCEWTIRELNSNQCFVGLKLRFQFQNPVYDFMAQSAGGLVSRRMIEAFTKRAIEQRGRI